MKRSERLRSKKANNKNLETNYFGFDDSDTELSLAGTGAPFFDEFQPDKPFRLALYKPIVPQRVMRVPKTNVSKKPEQPSARAVSFQLNPPAKMKVPLREKSSRNISVKNVNNSSLSNSKSRKKPNDGKASLSKLKHTEVPDKKEVKKKEEKKDIQESKEKENEDMEKWAETVNAEFSNVDNFELSFNYDE